LGLLVVMLYIFGIAFVQLCDDSPCEVFFPTVPDAMHELLLNAALMDGLSNLVLPLKEQSVVLLLVLYAFIFLSALTVMNMLIGVICEVVSAVAATERETLSLSFVREKIQELLDESGADEDGDQMITKDEFMTLITHPKAVPILEDVGVDVIGLLDFKDTLFEGDPYVTEDSDGESRVEEEKKLSFPHLMNLVLDLRGDNTATVRDIVNLRKYIHGRLSVIEQRLTNPRRRSSIIFPQPEPCQRASTAPAATGSGGMGETVATSQSDSEVLGGSFTNLGVTPDVQESLSNMRGLMSRHEKEVAALEADNRKLRDQVAKLVQDAHKWTQFKSHPVCKELGCTEAPDLMPCEKGNHIQLPKESLNSLQTEMQADFPRLSPPRPHGDDCQESANAFSTVLRATADGSMDFAKQDVDASTTGTVVDRGCTCGVAAADACSHHDSATGPSLPQTLPRQQSSVSGQSIMKIGERPWA